jgi:hypothetical protein
MGFGGIVNKGLKPLGLKIERVKAEPESLPVELSEKEKDLVRHIKTNKLTMASDQRLFVTIMACKHVIAQNIEGDFVECGVWRGGNSVLAASLFKLKGANRRTFLFDTFAGMTEPSEHDHTQDGNTGATESKFQELKKSEVNEWCFASLEDVRNNFARAGLGNEPVKFVKGDVRETLLREDLLPQKISILRLDTDFYDSTKLELEVLYPRLSAGGVIIIDDYGHWSGAQKAVDEYFDKNGNRPFFQYTDYTGRAGIKPQ